VNKDNIAVVSTSTVAVLVAMSIAFACVFVNKNSLEANKDKSTMPKWVHPYNHCLMIVTQKNADLQSAKGMCFDLLADKKNVKKI
jgi:hypothetical protein